MRAFFNILSFDTPLIKYNKGSCSLILSTKWDISVCALHYRLTINGIMFSCMSNSCVRLDIATLMLMPLLHPLLHETQCYCESVCHDG